MKRKHQRQVLINLLAIAVLAMFLWVHDGCPLPTLEMELHRTERQRLAEESRVVWTYEGRAYNDRDMLVGVTGNGVHAYSEVYGLDIWPRSVAEPTLVILPDRTRYTAQGGLFFFQLYPSGGSELEDGMSIQMWSDFSGLATFAGYGRYGEENWEWFPYTLEFFDGSGALIAAYDNPAAGPAVSTS